MARFTCRHLVAVITAYLEDALPGEERVRLERHLDHCDACRDYLEQMRRTIAVTGHLSEEQLDERSRADLLRLFRGWSAEPPS
jgi:anti-sigma factor RsiW